jgi:hypothetical protein
MSLQQANASQPMIPALSAFYRPLAPYGYAFMRFCVGAIIVPHGYTKLFQGAVGGAAGMIAKLGLKQRSVGQQCCGSPVPRAAGNG